MTDSDTLKYPALYRRLYGVWYRHMRVYTRNLLSNGFPPFLEPLIFLVGVGLGLGKYIAEPVGGVKYIEFLGAGLLVTTAMFTSAFECSFGTFIRLEFEKVYDGMLAAPMTVNNLIIGEMIWAGSKGFFFSFAVLCILSAFRIVALPYGLLVTSFVKTIQHFNFYFTGLISPMFFFSGVIFPVANLPAFVRPLAEIVPLTHSVRLVRAVCTNNYRPILAFDLLYVAVFIIVIGFFAIRRLRKRLVN